MSLVVTGTIGIDTIHAPTGNAESVLGGSCTYFSAAASLYGPVRMVAVVGDDFPDHHRATIRHFPNVDTAGLEVRRGGKTFRWGGKYLANMDQRESLFTDLGVIAGEPPAVPAQFRDSRCVFLANTHPAVQLGMLRNFPQARLAVADTMDLWINIAKPDLMELLRHVDGLVLNYDEAELLTGVRNPVTAARHVLDLGPAFVVVKKGEHGAIVVHRERGGAGTPTIAALPAYPAERVIDPTGAGDTFAGGMMGYLASLPPGGLLASRVAEGRGVTFAPLMRALAHGTVMASFTIEDFSLDRLKSLDRRQLDERLAEYTAMLRVE